MNALDKPNGTYKYDSVKCRMLSGSFTVICDFDKYSPYRDLYLRNVEIEISDNKTVIRGTKINQTLVDNNDDLFGGDDTVNWTDEMRAEYKDEFIDEVEVKSTVWSWSWPFRTIKKEMKPALKYGWCEKKKTEQMCVTLANGAVIITGVDMDLHYMNRK